MHASFLYLQYFFEKFYGQINVMRIFLKIREFFSEIKRYTFVNEKFIINREKQKLYFSILFLFYQNLHFNLTTRYFKITISSVNTSKFRITPCKIGNFREYSRYSCHDS